jgi:short-subunit dehydrogenase
MPKAQPTLLTEWALVTGASAGIGAAFSRRLAAEGRPVILVARDAERLERSAVQLREHYNVDVEVLPADLRTDVGCQAVAARLADTARPVETLINNAGIGLHQAFGDADLAAEEGLLDLNVRAVLRLTHAAITPMTARGRGEIINISSVAGFVPRGPAASYAASKAWVNSFTESVSLQLAGTGVTATAICPGFTHTEFHERADLDPESSTPKWMWLDPDRVVAYGMVDARAGKPISVPYRRYQLIVLVCKLLPRSVLRRIMSRA